MFIAQSPIANLVPSKSQLHSMFIVDHFAFSQTSSKPSELTCRVRAENQERSKGSATGPSPRDTCMCRKNVDLPPKPTEHVSICDVIICNYQFSFSYSSIESSSFLYHSEVALGTYWSMFFVQDAVDEIIRSFHNVPWQEAKPLENTPDRNKTVKPSGFDRCPCPMLRLGVVCSVFNHVCKLVNGLIARDFFFRKFHKFSFS